MKTRQLIVTVPDVPGIAGVVRDALKGHAKLFSKATVIPIPDPNTSARPMSQEPGVMVDLGIVGNALSGRVANSVFALGSL